MQKWIHKLHGIISVWALKILIFTCFTVCSLFDALQQCFYEKSIIFLGNWIHFRGEKMRFGSGRQCTESNDGERLWGRKERKEMSVHRETDVDAIWNPPAAWEWRTLSFGWLRKRGNNEIATGHWTESMLKTFRPAESERISQWNTLWLTPGLGL